MCWKTDLKINNSLFKIQVLSRFAMPRAISTFFSLPRQCVGKKTADDSIDTFVYYLGNGFGMHRHFAKGHDLVFKQLRLLVLPKFYCLLMKHMNGWNGRHCFSRYHLVLVLILALILTQFRSSRPEVFYKKDVLRNFAKFTGKRLC